MTLIFFLITIAINEIQGTGNPLPLFWLLLQIYLQKQMKLSWKSIKISIAGAKLSHLVQKDKIWDHGSMAEQARIIFYLVHKAKANGNVESLKKQCSVSCFEKIKAEKDNDEEGRSMIMVPVIKELAIVDVQPGKNNKPDMFCSLIRYHVKETFNGIETVDHGKEFLAKWCFIRQGDWWLLNDHG